MSSSIPASTPGKPWQPPAPEDLAPELPAYEILGLLGRGGMGAVYHARQKSLDREVAIKILPPTIEDGDMHFADRFKSEARAMAKLEHPGIVAVYDAGETASGLLYFVMQFVRGTDVAQMIHSSGRLPPEHAHAITAHVCDALAYAHGNGLIHRDIKPANIMVDTQGRVKVADFGLAKAVDAQTGFTQSNMAVGTPDFVAPEALIAGVAVDGRADLYAVGVMLYQMLTGHIPRGAWQPASVVGPGTDPRFDQIIVKAMAYDREQRHHSATELRQHLDTLLMPAVPAPDLQRYSSAQMPKQAAPPQSRPGVAAARPAAASSPPGAGRAKATPGLQPGASPAKSKTPLFIGLGAAAAIGIGAFVMFSGGEKAKQSSPRAPPSGTSVAAAPKPSPTPTPVKVIEPPKPEPNLAVVAKAPEPAKAEPPKPETTEPKPEPPKPAMADAGVKASADSGKPAPAPAPSRPDRALASTPTPPASSSPSPPISESPPLPPELATLDAQFIALQKERVTAPFEADMAKLNSSYLGGIGKKIAEEKAAGHLDGILALEAEQKLITGKLPVPDTDDDKTPASLKSLRVIYREQFAKLAATRAANLKALTDPLDKRLAQMETDFTKADRLADAKTVRGYREALSEGSADTPVRNETAGGGAAKMNEADKSVRAPLSPAATLVLKDGLTNTLGMKFVKVPGTDVLFCIHETRYKDYAAYAAENPDIDGAWKNQTHHGYALAERSEQHPVVNVSWEDAQKFCAWLSKKEGKTYRLPTDEEWSIAVGLGRKEKHGKNITPAMLNSKETTEFPWGSDFPPKGKEPVGNYSDESRKAKAPQEGEQYLERYDDGFPTTAPVMSYKPNKLGLHDLGGNVWEWCEDWCDNAKIDRVLRGGSWFDPERALLLSSFRYRIAPAIRRITYGFRVVLDFKAPAPQAAAPAPPPAPVVNPAATLALKDGFTNTLGMKFVNVKDTKVMFCIHETRRQDYAAYANEVPGVDGAWKNQQRDGIPCGHEDNHPVVGVSWEDAQKFCEWLGKKEGKSYRLPTDEEWSIAVGLGQKEKHGNGITPEMLSQKEITQFPWGEDYPPKTTDQAGNYADESWREKFPTMPMIRKYSDGFPTTAPVMSLKPNKIGLYDMGGNVSEWCEDWYNAAQKEHVLRGGCYLNIDRANLLSSNRHHYTPDDRHNNHGFRVVMVMQ